jgi:hypothetical protein
MKLIDIFIILSLIFLCSCKNQPKIYHNWTKGYINLFGKYINDKEHLQLVVYDENGLLRYNLVNNKDTDLKSNENASIYQQWFLYLDENKYLWVESSDIGIWVWSRSSNNQYQKFDIDKRPKSCKIIPKQFLDSALIDYHDIR